MTKSSQKTKSSAMAPMNTKNRSATAKKAKSKPETTNTDGSSEDSSDEEAGRRSRKGSNADSSEELDEDSHNPEIEVSFCNYLNTLLILL